VIDPFPAMSGLLLPKILFYSFLGLPIGRLFISFPHGINSEGVCFIVNDVDQMQPHGTELNLVRIYQSTDLVRLNLLIFKTFRQFLLELFPYRPVQLTPFLESGFLEFKVITH